MSEPIETWRETDYLRVLDDDVLAFIKNVETYFPQTRDKETIAKRRTRYDAMAKGLCAPSQEDIIFRELDSPVPLRAYLPKNPSTDTEILYIHGGGFVLGNLESHHDICADIGAGTEFYVTAVDYRLAPEHIYPACRDDCCDALRYLARQSDRSFILMGDSAGGYLAAATALEIRDNAEGELLSRIIGIIGIYPTYGGDRSFSSYQLHANAPMLTTAGIAFYDKLLFNSDSEAARAAAPLMADDLSRMPPSISFSAQCDPLADDGPLFTKRLKEAGCKASCIIDMGLVHAHLRARHSTSRASESFARVLATCKSLGRGEWPAHLHD